MTHLQRQKKSWERWFSRIFLFFCLLGERSWLKLNVIFKLLKLIKSLQKFHLFFSNKRKSGGLRASALPHLSQHFLAYLVPNG
jgi:hypothetical protein